MPNGGKIDFQVGFKTDKSGLNQLNRTIQDLQNKLAASANKNGMSQSLRKATDAAKELQKIVAGSWSNKLQQLNLNKFNDSIKKSYGSVSNLRDILVQSGTDGQQAFLKLSTQVLNTNTQLRESSKLLDDMADTFGKTVKYGIASSVFNNIKNSLQQAFYFAKDLDLSLTNIRIVTGDSADQMERFSKTANQAAKNLGRSTLDYTNAALTFYQQGLDDEQVNARTQATMMAQNITGTGTQMADYLTAVWNGYKVGAEEAVEYVDKLAAVADSSASDMSQLAIAMSKVASAANVMGVNSDQLNAQLATVIATTRQAPESIGTAFKTIYARINDIKAGTDEAQISLGNYSGKMASLGFNVFDTNGKLKDTGDVIEEVGKRWGQLSREQQIYLAQVMGGTRQYSRLISLFDNWNMYTEMLNVSLNSQGTLLEKNDRYMDSVKAHMEELNAETERTYTILSDTGAINGLVDILNGLLTTFNDFIEGLGGGITAFTYFGSVIASVFNKQLSEGILSARLQFSQFFADITGKTSKAKQEWLQSANFIFNVSNGGITNAQSAGFKAQIQAAEEISKIAKGLTAEETKQAMEIQKKIGLNAEQIAKLEEQQKWASTLTAEEERRYNNLNKNKFAVQDELEAQKRRAQLLQNTQSVFARIAAIQMDGANDAKVQAAAIQVVEQNSQKLKEAWQAIGISQDAAQQKIQNLKAAIQAGEPIIKNWSNVIKQIKNELGLTEEQVKILDSLYQKLNTDVKQRLANQKKNGEELNKQKDTLISIGSIRVNTQTLVRGISALGQVISAVAGGIKVFKDEASTGAEKANASFSMLQGTITAIGSFVGGPFGFAVSSLINSVLSAIKQITPFGDWLEHFFSSTQQKLEKIKKNQQEINNSQKEYVNARKEIEGIREDYERLSRKSGEFTEEEQARWNEIASIFEKYNSDVILGYDQQGNAIINKNAKIDDSISKLKDEYDQIIANKLAMQDLSDYDAPYEEAKKERKKAQKKRDEVKKQSIVSKPYESSEVQDLKNNLGSIYNNIVDYINDETFSEHTSVSPEMIRALQLFQNTWNNQNSSFEKIQEAFNELKKTLLEFSTVDGNTMEKGLLDRLFKPSESTIKTVKDLKKALSDLQAGLNTKQTQAQNAHDAKVNEADQMVSAALEAEKEAGIISIDTIQKNMALGENFKNEKNKLTEEQWEAYGKNAAYAVAESYVTGINSVFEQGFDKAVEAGVDPPDAMSTDQVLKGLDVALAGLFDGINLDAVDEAAEKMQKQLQKKTSDNVEDSIKEINKIKIDTAKKLYDNYSKQDKTGSNGNFIRYIIGNALGVNFDKDGEISTDQLQDVDDAIISAIDGIKNANPNFAGNLTDTILANNFSEENIQSFKQEMMSMSEQTFNDFINWLDTADLKGKETFADILKAFKDFQNGLDKEALEEVLSFDDIEKTIKNLSDKKSINSIAKGAAADYVKDAMKKNQEVRETAFKYGLNSPETAEALRQNELNKQNLQLEKQNKELDKLQKKINNINNGIGEFKDLTGSERLEKIKSVQDDYVDKQIEISQTQSNIDRLIALETEETKSQLQLLKQQKSSLDEVKSAYEKMWSDSDLTDKENAAVDELATRYSQLAQAEAQHGKGSIEYLEVLKEVLALEEKRLKARQGQVINIQNEIKDWETYLNDFQQAKANSTDPEKIAGFQKRITRANEAIAELKSQLEEMGVSEEDIAEIIGLDLDGLTLKYTTLSEQVDGLNKYYDKLNQGIELSKQEHRDFIDLLDGIKNKYPELEAVVEKLNKTWMSGTEEYSQALQELQSKLTSFSLQEAYDQLQTDLDMTANIFVQIDDQNFQGWKKDVEQFFEDDKVMSIAVDNALDQEINKIKKDFDEIYSAASKIGEGFKVSASDIGEITRVFPQITEGMVRFADGSYELNQQVVQQAIAAAQEEVAANGQAITAKIKQQADYHNAKAAIYDQIAALAGQMAENQVMTEEDKNQRIGQINGLLSQLQEQNKGKVVEYQKKANDEIKVKEQDTATHRQSINANMYRSFTEMSNARAQQDIANTQAMFDADQARANNMRPADYVIGNGLDAFSGRAPIQSSYQVIDSGSTAQDTFTINPDFSTYSTQDWLDLQSQAKARAEQERRLAEVAMSKYYDMLGQANRTIYGLGNVAKGQGIEGAKPEKQKEEKQKKEKQPAQPGTEEYLQEEFDLYHDINIILSKIDRQLKNIQKDQQKLTGAKLVENYQQQLDLLNQQIAAQKEKIGLAEWEAASLQNVLASQGVVFNSDGTIANYMSTLQAKENEVNSFISYYNSLSKEQQEAIKGVLDSVKSEYEDLKKNISKYDNLVNEMIPDLADQIKDELDKKVEINIAKSKMAVDIKIDMSQLQRDYNNFVKTIKRQVRQDNVLGNTYFAFEDLQSYFKDGIYNSTKAQTDQLYFIMDQIRQINQSSVSEIYGDNKKQALEDLDHYRESLEGDLQNILELVNQIKQNVIKAIEQVQEGFENRQKYYDHISGLLDHDLKMVELIYGDKAYQRMDNLYKLQHDRDVQHLTGLAQEKNFWEQQLIREREHQKTLEWEGQQWYQSQERIKKFEQNWMEATEKLNSSFEDSVQNIIDKYQNGIKKIFHELELQLFNGNTFEYIDTEWQLLTKQSKMYLDNVNRIYAIDKLSSGYDELFKKMKGNTKAQKEINAAKQAEIQSLRSITRLDQGRVDIANQRLRVLEAEKALEDSRNNRSTLQLRRDSQGNYSYQYAADADDNAEKLQTFKDEVNELYNLTKNLREQAYSKIPEMYQEMTSKIMEIRMNQYLDDEEKTRLETLTREKYTQLMQEQADLASQYSIELAKETLAVITDEGEYSYRDVFDPSSGKLTTYLGYGAQSVETWAQDNEERITQMMQNMIDGPYADNRAAFEEMIFGQGNGMVLLWNNGVTNFVDKIVGPGGLEPIMDETMAKLNQLTEDYRLELDNLADAAQIDTDQIGEGLNNDIQITDELISTNEMLLHSYQNVFDDMMNYWIPTLETYIDKHKELQDAINAVTEAYKIQQEEQRRAAEAATQMTLVNNGDTSLFDGTYNQVHPDISYGGDYGSGYGGYSDDYGGSYGFGGGGFSVGSTVRFLSGRYTADSYGGGTSGDASLGSYVTITHTNPGAPRPYHISGSDYWGNYSDLGWVSEDQLGFKSGGYTGDWNSSNGKWALLHQKELILNAQDTENILNAVNIVRGYNDALNRLQDYQNELLFGSGINNIYSNRQQVPIEQVVHINADFPAVRESREIELAFQNLTNRASQYIFSSR